MIPPLCQCGCNKPTKPYKRNRPYLGHVKGEYPKYLNGHNKRKHAKTIIGEYEAVRMPNHPNAFSGGYVFKHIAIVTKVLGKPLPEGVQVHHADGNPLNNEKSNLVVCPNQTYHKLLHQRTNALETCGNPDWIKCTYCSNYDDPSRIYIDANNVKYHRECKARYENNRRKSQR